MKTAHRSAASKASSAAVRSRASPVPLASRVLAALVLQLLPLLLRSAASKGAGGVDPGAVAPDGGRAAAAAAALWPRRHKRRASAFLGLVFELAAAAALHRRARQLAVATGALGGRGDGDGVAMAWREAVSAMGELVSGLVRSKCTT